MNSLSHLLVRFSLFLVVALTLFGALPSVGAAAPTYYCAIAFSQKTGGYGYTYNQRSAEGARIAAVNSCYSRTRDARPATYVARNGWAALAVGRGNGYGWGLGATKAVAERNALISCSRYTSGARIRVSTPSYYRR